MKEKNTLTWPILISSTRLIIWAETRNKGIYTGRSKSKPVKTILPGEYVNEWDTFKISVMFKQWSQSKILLF